MRDPDMYRDQHRYNERNRNRDKVLPYEHRDNSV